MSPKLINIVLDTIDKKKNTGMAFQVIGITIRLDYPSFSDVQIGHALNVLIEENLVKKIEVAVPEWGNEIIVNLFITAKGIVVIENGGFENYVKHKMDIEKKEEEKLTTELKFTKNSNRSLWANLLFALVSTIFIVFTWWDSHTDTTSTELRKIKNELEMMRLQTTSQAAQDTLQIKIPVDALSK